jgi:YidC/Oxa1 family membrane protein insertase
MERKMGMDRNTVIGFVLLGLLLFIYLFTATKNSQQLERQRLQQADSLAAVKKVQEALHVVRDSVKVKVASGDSLTGFNKAIGGSEKLLTVENDLLKVVFSNKGGQPKEVVLKNFKSLIFILMMQGLKNLLMARRRLPIHFLRHQDFPSNTSL